MHKKTDCGGKSTALTHCWPHIIGRNQRVCMYHWSAQELESKWEVELYGHVTLLTVSLQHQQMLSLGDLNNEKCKNKV